MRYAHSFLVLAGAALFCAAHARSATPEAKALYAQTHSQAKERLAAAHAQCHALAGNARDVCDAAAKAEFVKADEDGRARYDNTLKAYTRARMRIASANYDLDRARCGALGGNDKDVCIERAKATRVAAESDAKADQIAFEARQDARDDKRTAQYRVALEQCDAYAGVAKDQCVQAAKTQYGQ
jgi:hypothetical protein